MVYYLEFPLLILETTKSVPVLNLKKIADRILTTVSTRQNWSESSRNLPKPPSHRVECRMSHVTYRMKE